MPKTARCGMQGEILTENSKNVKVCFLFQARHDENGGEQNTLAS
jgi:hypothetical protein